MTSHGGGPEITPGLHRVPWGGETLKDYAAADAKATEAMYASKRDDEDEDPVAIKRLHPMQWVTYITVVITCLVVMYAMLETYLFIGRVQDALSKLGEAFNNNLGVF
jgi:hypothetical protein